MGMTAKPTNRVDLVATQEWKTPAAAKRLDSNSGYLPERCPCEIEVTTRVLLLQRKIEE